MMRLNEIALARGLNVITGLIIAANGRMLANPKALGFTFDDSVEQEVDVKHVRLTLSKVNRA
jgi:hypothetical protein